MSEILRPNKEDVAWVRVFVGCESVIFGGPTENVERMSRLARASLQDYLGPFERAEAPGVWIGEEVEPSEYDSDLQVWAGQVDSLLTVDEWIQVARDYDMEIEDGQLLPADERITSTMGILDASGIVPAVAIEGTDEGWGFGGYEPSLIASFAVAFAMKAEDWRE